MVEEHEAAYNFKLETDGYGDTEVCVQASSYTEARELAEKLIEGSKLKLGDLRRVIDFRLQVHYTDILERKLTIDEHHLKHSGEITEVRVDGGTRMP